MEALFLDCYSKGLSLRLVIFLIYRYMKFCKTVNVLQFVLLYVNCYSVFYYVHYYALPAILNNDFGYPVSIMSPLEVNLQKLKQLQVK